MNNWTVLGAGAIGGLFACELKAASVEVNIANRANQPITNRCIEVQRDNKHTRFEFEILKPNQVIQSLILATKTYQSEAAIQQIATQLAAKPTILVLQNGMGVTEWLQACFPDAIILAATTTHGAFRSDHNTIVHAGTGTTWLGPLSKDHLSAAQQLHSSWQQKGVSIDWDANIEKRLWLKLAINCAINPLTVLYDCRNGELLNNPQARQLMADVITEYIEVYEAIFSTPVNDGLLGEVYSVAEKTAQNISSMRQDRLNKRPTEIDAINGYLVNRGKEAGIACPVNARLVSQIKELTLYD